MRSVSTIIFLFLFVAQSALATPLFQSLTDKAPDLDEQVLRLALKAHSCATRDSANPSRFYSIIDYTLSSTLPRFWLFDLSEKTLLLEELVAHGKYTGEEYANHFSNSHGTKKSSFGLFRTANAYQGKNGYSLRLHGLEPGFNDNAYDRNIVMHGAWYVSEAHADQYGRLGRSWGCPAFREQVAERIIDTIKEEELVFIYYPDEKWLKQSRYLHCKVNEG